LNSVKLSGRLTRDPELKQTQAGVPVASFGLAVDRKFNRDEADFIPITAWRKTAEFVAKYFHKGQRVIISEGRIRVTPYTDRDGNKRTHFEVVADEVEFGESKRAPEDQEAGSVAADYMTSGQFEELGEEDPGDLPF
jgi:single-strand DNA-binding protein